MNTSKFEMEERLHQLEARRARLESEIATLRALIDTGRTNVTRLDSWAVSGDSTRMPKRRPTRPYIDGMSAPLERGSSPMATALPLGVGTPLLGETPAPEELADFDAGQLRSMSDEALDALPYGLVIVDLEGKVLRYNDTESRMVGLPAERVVGLNFFRDIAPCTRVRGFEGRFREFAKTARGYAVETFDFVFRFQRETQYVTIYLTPGRARGTVNIAMMRRRREKP